MPERYMASLSAAAGALAADAVTVLLWNPHASIDIVVHEVWRQKNSGAAENLGLIRCSTTGTASVTTTPGLAHHYAYKFAPISGAVFYSTFTAQPTVAGPYLHRINAPLLTGTLGPGFFYIMMNYEPIVVPAGTGLAIASPLSAVTVVGYYTFVWEE